jgi:hypothetical protein
MPVSVQRQHCRFVPEKPKHHLHIRPALMASEAPVAQIVQPYPVDPVDRAHRFGERVPGLTQPQVAATARGFERQRIADDSLWPGPLIAAMSLP